MKKFKYFSVLLSALLLLTSCSGSEQQTKSSDTIEENAEAIEELPFKVASWDKIRLMSPAVAPYLIELSKEQIQTISEAIQSSYWEKIDNETPRPDGEAYSVFIYNNGEPFRLIFYADYTVDFEQNGDTQKYMVTGNADKIVSDIINSEDVYNHLVQCELEKISSEEVWEDVTEISLN